WPSGSGSTSPTIQVYDPSARRISLRPVGGRPTSRPPNVRLSACHSPTIGGGAFSLSLGAGAATRADNAVVDHRDGERGTGGARAVPDETQPGGGITRGGFSLGCQSGRAARTRGAGRPPDGRDSSPPAGRRRKSYSADKLARKSSYAALALASSACRALTLA